MPSGIFRYFQDTSRTFTRDWQIQYRPLGTLQPLRLMVPGQEKYFRVPKVILDVQIHKSPHWSLQHLKQRRLPLGLEPDCSLHPIPFQPVHLVDGHMISACGRESCFLRVDIWRTLHVIHPTNNWRNFWEQWPWEEERRLNIELHRKQTEHSKMKGLDFDNTSRIYTTISHYHFARDRYSFSSY